MKIIVKMAGLYPAGEINWMGRKRVVCACVLAGLHFFSTGTAFAVVAGYDFGRYQVILDKKPFGEVTPSEVAQPQAALGDVISKELEMKSIIDDGAGIRIGLLDKKTNKNISLGVGENYDGIQVVSVNYENEEAVLKKGAETAVVKLRPDKDKDKAAGPVVAPVGMGELPFQAPPSPFAAAQPSSPAARKPFFTDLKKRRMTPFQPVGTNVLPFQAKPLDSFFKVSTGAFPQAQSPFGPFQPPAGSAKSEGFQQLIRAGSNVPNPFAPISPPNPGAATEQPFQGQAGGQGQDQAPVMPSEGEVPVEEIAP